MKILSLFDGMACGMLAMQTAGVNVNRYVAYEIDKYAVKTSSHNFPIIEHEGDVFQADFTQYFGCDYVLAGFPCTKFSIAQKNNRETKPYSGEGWLLFEQAWRAVCEAKPMFFIFENNKSMAKPVQQEISRIVGFEPICINSALVSAQNRQRIYWVGKRNPWGGYSKVHVDQPEDRGVLLRDVLDRVGAKCLTEREMDYMVRQTSGVRNHFDFGYIQDATRGKGACLTANVSKGVPYNVCCEPVQILEHSTGVAYRGRTENGKWVKRYESNGTGKANALTTAQTDSMVSEPIRVGALPRPNGELSTSQAFRVYSTAGKSVNITAGGGGAGGKTGLYAIPVEFDGETPTMAVSCADGKKYPVYEVKDGFITIKGKRYAIKLADGFYIIRKLTVNECKRLQTVPDWYEFPVSDSQAYKMLGNGWTVDVIAHLIKATQNCCI